MARAAMEKLAGQLRAIPVRLQRLQKSGMRGLRKVAVEFALATTAWNLTRMWRLHPPGQGST